MSKQSYSCEFSRLPVGAEFSQNGNRCRKRSTRTAELLDYGRRFYFRASEQVRVTQEVRDLVVQSETAVGA